VKIKRSVWLLAGMLWMAGPAWTADYYIAPDKNWDGSAYAGARSDDFAGTQVQPWATFDHAWTVLQPGDTLWLLDGIYTQSIVPTINGDGPLYGAGRPERRITVKALHDGRALIDGEYLRTTVLIGQLWDNISHTRDTVNPQGNYFTVEGLVARNSATSVYYINARDVTLRRCSGYNANTHQNEHVITIWSLGTPQNPANVLVEDCVAAGSGRKMIVAYDTYVNVVFRRNFAAWQTWTGDEFCQSYWPQSDGIEIYPKAYEDQPDVLNNTFLENNIYFGLSPNTGYSLNPNPGNSIGNNFLGDMSFVTVPYSSNPCSYNNLPLPGACASSTCIQFANGEYRGGFALAANCSQKDYLTKNNTFQDIFAWANGGPGLSSTSCGWGSGASNNRIIRATLVGNGVGIPAGPQGAGVNASAADLSLFTSITDSNIPGTSYNGAGAKIQYRYVDGTLTNDSLWPWPMEERIKAEFADPGLFQADGVPGQVWTNFSVTQTVCEDILVPNGSAMDCGGPTQLPAPKNLRIVLP
jgi:hypothetical protein